MRLSKVNSIKYKNKKILSSESKKIQNSWNFLQGNFETKARSLAMRLAFARLLATSPTQNFFVLVFLTRKTKSFKGYRFMLG